MNNNRITRYKITNTSNRMVETLRRGIPDLVVSLDGATKSAAGVYPVSSFYRRITKIFESSALAEESTDRDSLTRDIGGLR